MKTFEFTKIIGKENIKFGQNIIIDDFVLIYAKKTITLGNYIHIGAFSSVMAGEEIEMHDFSGLSHGVRIFTDSDDFKEWGFGNPTISKEFRNIKSSPVRIGRFSVIGANSVILPGVTIGEGVSVGAGSVISRDLKDWGIYIGNRRFGERNKKGVMDNYAEFSSSNHLEEY